MTEKFQKLVDSEEKRYLLRNHPFAFLLLTLIAERANRLPNSPDGLEIGECIIGDLCIEEMTRRKYRTAKAVLVARNHIKIIETSKRRNEATIDATIDATIKATINGTKVKLISSSVYDLNFSTGDDHSDKQCDHRCDHQITVKPSPPSGSSSPSSFSLSPSPLDPPSPISISLSPSSPNPQEFNKNFMLGAPDKPASKPKDALTFSFEKFKFEGITLDDRANWKLAYPSINLDQEIAKAEIWLKSNPSRNAKKLWRKYLTGWFSRAEDRCFNKAAIVEQKREVIDESTWSQTNRQNFFKWRTQNFNAFKHLEYKNDYIINTRKGTELSTKMNPEAFQNVFGAFAGLKCG